MIWVLCQVARKRIEKIKEGKKRVDSGLESVDTEINSHPLFGAEDGDTQGDNSIHVTSLLQSINSILFLPAADVQCIVLFVPDATHTFANVALGMVS